MTRLLGHAVDPALLLTPAYRPFLDPLDVHASWWLTVFPLVVLLSMAFKSSRVGDLRQYWKQVAIMSVQLVLLLIGLAAALHAFVEWILPVIER